ATSSQHTTSSIPLPSIPTAPIPTVTQTDTTPIIQYSRRARIAQSSVFPTVADEPASSVRDDSQGEACPTNSGFIADQDRETIAKLSTLPRDSAPRVNSPAAEEGSMQQTLHELTAFCTSLQRQHLELLAKFQAQEVEIDRLKDRVKYLEDKEGVIEDKSGDDAPIKGRSTNEEEAPAEKISTDSEEIARVLTSIDAATVLAGETNKVNQDDWLGDLSHQCQSTNWIIDVIPYSCTISSTGHHCPCHDNVHSRDYCLLRDSLFIDCCGDEELCYREMEGVLKGVKGVDEKTGNRPLKSILKKSVYMPLNVPDVSMMSKTIPIGNEKAGVHEDSPFMVRRQVAMDLIVTVYNFDVHIELQPEDNIAANGNDNTYSNKDEGVQPDVETPYPFTTSPMESDANSGGYKADVSAGIPQQKKGSFASLLCLKVVINKLKNFRTFVTDEKVESSDCVHPKAAADKGRISFARALIKISSDSTLKDEFITAILEEEGDSHIKEVIRVVYEWKPSHCVECKCFGHGPNSRPKHVKEDRYVAANKPSNTKNNGEGFVEVKSQKNKRKDVSHSIGGIGPNKSKSNFYWMVRSVERKIAYGQNFKSQKMILFAIRRMRHMRIKYMKLKIITYLANRSLFVIIMIFV
nr:hypothetical protein [Tanacetum cinerariifolium]